MRQQQEQEGVAEEKGREEEAPRSKIEHQIEVAKLLLCNRKADQVVGFVMVYRLYIRMRIRDAEVEKQF